MEQMKRILCQMLKPGAIWTACIAFVAALLLLYVFLSGHQESPIAYFSYLLSTYAMVILVQRIPRIVRNTEALIRSNKYGNRYLSDADYRAKVALYCGVLVNTIYAGFRLVTGLIYASTWFGAIAVYYLILSGIRLLLLRDVRKVTEDDGARYDRELRTYRLCGYLMLLLNSAMTGMVVQMIWQNKGYQHSELGIYASAAFAFYCMILAIINMVKYRKMDSPVLSAAKMLSFSGALMSILALQTALLTQFSEGGQFAQIMNLLMGASVCIIVFCLAVFMVIRANRLIAARASCG